jgi:small subunit ribosomal protein S21
LAVGIKVRENETIDRALRRFKRSVNRSKLLRIYRSNLAYTKPSEIKRAAEQKAVRAARKRRSDDY